MAAMMPNWANRKLAMAAMAAAAQGETKGRSAKKQEMISTTVPTSRPRSMAARV